MLLAACLPHTQPYILLNSWYLVSRNCISSYSSYTVVSRKYAPPFATLALVQSVGGAYTRDATSSLAITPPPPDREMFSGSVLDAYCIIYGSVDAGLFLCCHSTMHGDLEPNCVEVSARGGGGEREARDGEMLPSGGLASFSVERRESRALPQSSWRVHRRCGRSAFAVDNSNTRQPNDREMFSGSVDAACFVLALSFHHGDLKAV